MSGRAKTFLHGWLVTTLGVLVAAGIVNGVHADGAIPLLTASLILGILNAIIRPFLLLVTLPLVLFSFGLFIFVVNAALLYFVANLVKGFSVSGFWPAFKGALVISITSMIANMILGKKRIENRPPPPRQRPPNPDHSGGGPVIDV